MKLETKYGILNNVNINSLYENGKIESCELEEESELNILDQKIIPLYTMEDHRRKDNGSIKFFRSGNIKAISLNNLTEIITTAGKYEVEKIIFYENGSINRLFLLDGKLSGYWSEEDEYKLAKEYKFEFQFAKFTAKVMSLHFYESKLLKSITLWPKERIKLVYKDKTIPVRIGFSIYENGALRSCEPAIGTEISTPIGIIEAFDINAIGIHGEINSLNFYEDGNVKELITSSNKIIVFKSDGEVIVHSPKKVRIYSNSDILDTITVKVEFINDNVIIDDKFIYKYIENTFQIDRFGEKTLTF